ncbi:hypothetical protein J7T55_009547 [Diaporthe amygdali]|uniref:uncharacterized protein n=1 Tax=Phomopsis amygdali TaxID=1214568 RepID=UPI0022FDEDF2|nr:uncharacterized protein J7T55_009547 [Diaporthe amygdali]KAJ0109216.1 hypothetical protein J7T55_009547 [Diaporthe amygdali]
MKFFACLIILTIAAISAAKPVEKRQMGGVLICNGANATGDCSYQVYELDSCHNMTSQFSNNAATFAPDDDDFHCFPYLMACGGICTSPTGCSPGAISYDTPEKFNLTALSGWDHLISSFECNAGRASS